MLFSVAPPPSLRPVARSLPRDRIPTRSVTRSSLPVTRNANRLSLSSPSPPQKSTRLLHRTESYASPQQNLGLRRDPDLGLFSLLFVLSMVAGSFVSVAVISLTTLCAFRRLTISTNKLSKVVSEEVPGTLSSLKLSGLEISDLTCQLNYLRQRISGNQYGKKIRTDKPRPRGGQRDQNGK